MIEILSRENPFLRGYDIHAKYEALLRVVDSGGDVRAAGIEPRDLTRFVDRGLIECNVDEYRRAGGDTGEVRDHVDYSRARERPCMTCGRPFPSVGAHNRMCDACRQL